MFEEGLLIVRAKLLRRAFAHSLGGFSVAPNLNSATFSASGWEKARSSAGLM
jgi:hypothetical protein